MTIGGYYQNTHRSQYAPDQSVLTHHAGCTWTSAANGADAATVGRVNRTPDQVHALVSSAEETNAATPGWSLHDAQLALTRLGVPTENRSGRGWAAVILGHTAGLYQLVQGDSDRFGDATCSGAFDGNHCIGIHPASRTTPEGVLEWWIDDPICPSGRWERPSVLQAYAQKLQTSVLVLALTTPVVRPPTRFRVAITGPTKLYDRVNGTVIGAVSRATYTCTRLRVDGLWWYRIAEGTRKGQAFKPNRYTKASVIS